MIGRQLAHYEITEKLGEGGMGVVYRARDSQLDRDVALKVLPPAMAEDAQRLERFAREAKLVAGLNHPSIVTLHSVEHADGVHFLTMELVDGMTLDQVIPHGGLELERLFELAIPIADAVAAAHEAGITHRDLKPANVMVARDGRVKILDFGLARLDAGAASSAEALTEAITQEGVIVGTARYMSPEQAKGESVDARSDIFSLGTLLYEMVTGKQPFSGESSAELVSAILRDDPPPVSEIKEELPYHLGRVIQRCLEKDPRKRYQAALDVRNELEGLKREVEAGVSRSSSEVATAVQAPPGRAGRRWALGAVALLAVLALAFFVWFRGRERIGEDGSAPAAPAAVATRKMIVVLPFENLGSPEDAYFAAGMTDELTSRLARVSGLGVISRSSAQRYAATELALQQVGRELGVAYVVEGTVRWAKSPDGTSRVRITPQLVQVVDETQLWSASFDRDLEDVFSIQAEIAGQVIEELDVALLAPERAAVEQRPTENMEAYQAWLKGQEHWQIAGFDRERFDRAAELFERAAVLDPEFLLPNTELVSVYGVTAFISRDPELLEKMQQALARAEALAPQAPEVELARGVWHYYAEQDYPAAFERLEAAARALPNDVRLIGLMAFVRRRQGRLEETIDLLKRALEISPQDAHTHYEVGRTLMALHLFPAAEGYLERASKLAPDDVSVFRAYSELMVRWKGDLDAAVAIASRAPNMGDWRGDTPLESLDWLRREWSAQRRRLEARANVHRDPVAAVSDAIDLAFVYDRLGESMLGQSQRQQALESARALVQSLPKSGFAHFELAIAEALNGSKSNALAAVDKGAELLGPDRFLSPLAEEIRAFIYTQVGDQDNAIDLLENLLTQAYDEPLTVPLLRLDPSWDSLRDNPRFKTLVAGT